MIRLLLGASHSYSAVFLRCPIHYYGNNRKKLRVVINRAVCMNGRDEGEAAHPSTPKRQAPSTKPEPI